MGSFLTTREMQELINVDRSTIYRMAEDGRIPAVKVGRQWRFPADRVAVQFGLESAPNTSTAPVADGVGRGRLSDLLAAETVQPLADLVGELFGVMAVVTDMDGTPLSSVANQCGFYRAIADEASGSAVCVSGWRQLADEPAVSPRFVGSELGFLCARTFVWVNLQPVGMIVVGGITPKSWPPSGQRLGEIADLLGRTAADLAPVVNQTWDTSPEEQERILRLLPKVGDLVSQLATTRSQLLGRLDGIAELARSVGPQGR